MKFSFSQIKTITLSLFYLSMLFWYNPSVGVVGLAEYVVLTSYLIFTEEDPDLVPEDVE